MSDLRSWLAKIILILITIPLFASALMAQNLVEYVVDFSGSMEKIDKGETQIDIARRALVDGLKALPSDAKVALRFYGHRVAKADKARSCLDTNLEIAFSEADPSFFKQKLDAYKPLGQTPIGYSLEQASGDFSAASETAKRTIVLLSDGEETCGGDPVGVVKALRSKGFDITIHAIGFNVDAKTRQLLEAVAQAGGGQYFDAQGATGLASALKSVGESAFIQKKAFNFQHDGRPVRGGDDYSTAVALPMGEVLKLDHHQRPKEYDSFYIDMEEFETIQLWGKTLEKGVNVLKDGKAQDNSSARGRIEMRRDSDNKVLENLTLIGNLKDETKLFHPGPAGRYYFLVGGDFGINKDGFQFSATRLTFSGADRVHGGTTFETATPFPLDQEVKIDRHLGAKEILYFTIPLKVGDTLLIKAENSNKGLIHGFTESGLPRTGFAIRAPGKQKLADGTVSNQFESKELSIVAQESGNHYLLIGSNYFPTHADGASYMATVKAVPAG